MADTYFTNSKIELKNLATSFTAFELSLIFFVWSISLLLGFYVLSNADKRDVEYQRLKYFNNGIDDSFLQFSKDYIFNNELKYRNNGFECTKVIFQKEGEIFLETVTPNTMSCRSTLGSSQNGKKSVSDDIYLSDEIKLSQLVTMSYAFKWNQEDSYLTYSHIHTLFSFGFLAYILFSSLSLVFFAGMISYKRKVEESSQKNSVLKANYIEMLHEIKTPVYLVKANSFHIFKKLQEIELRASSENRTESHARLLPELYESVKEHNENISESLKGLSSRKFEEILDQDGKLRITERDFLSSIIELISTEYAKSKINENAGTSFLDLVYDDSLPRSLTMNHQHANIILRNLVSNALKYTDNMQGVIIRILPQGNDESSKDDLLIEVEDRGIGMSAKELAEIGLSGVTRESDVMKGSGYGISIVQRRCKENKYSISVDSQEGRGTVWRVVVPNVVDKGLAPTRPISESLTDKNSAIFLVSPASTNSSWDRSNSGLSGLAKNIQMDNIHIGLQYIPHKKGVILDSDAIESFVGDKSIVILDPPNEESVKQVLNLHSTANVFLIFELISPFEVDSPRCETIYDIKYSKKTARSVLGKNKFKPRSTSSFGSNELEKNYVEKAPNILSGLNLLVIDDCSVTYKTMSYDLQEANLNVDYWNVPDEFVSSFEQGIIDKNYDIAIVDYRMGEKNLNGVETIEKLREFYGPEILLCLHTANISAGLAEEYQQSIGEGKMSVLLDKDGPFDLEELSNAYIKHKEGLAIMGVLSGSDENLDDREDDKEEDVSVLATADADQQEKRRLAIKDVMIEECDNASTFVLRLAKGSIEKGDSEKAHKFKSSFTKSGFGQVAAGMFEELDSILRNGSKPTRELLDDLLLEIGDVKDVFLNF